MGISRAGRACGSPVVRGELIAHRWTGYDVRFHNLRRTLRGPYAAITSPRFAAVVEAAFARSPASTVRLGCPVSAVHGDHVVLGDGERIRAPLVIDARGPDPDAAHADCGFQKFLGLEIELRTRARRRRGRS